MSRWLTMALLAVACAIPPTAGASPLGIAQDGPTTVSALGSRVVFSRPLAGAPRRFILVQALPGRDAQRVPKVEPQRFPFDVDLGRDASGRVVAVYSRCAAGSAIVAPYGAGLPRRDLARGCKIWQYTFATQRNKRLRIGSRTDSTYLPSRWGHLVAYARRDETMPRRAGGAVSIAVTNLRTGRTWRRPGGPAGYIDTALRFGGPGPIAIDLRGARLAYSWGWSSGQTCPLGSDPDTGHVGPFRTQIWLDDARSRAHDLVSRACAEIATDFSVQGVALTARELAYGRNRQGYGEVVLRSESHQERSLVAMLAPVTSVALGRQAGFASTRDRAQKIVAFPYTSTGWS